ncbi:FK506-binding protein-like [Aplochiton taeniatus]
MGSLCQVRVRFKSHSEFKHPISAQGPEELSSKVSIAELKVAEPTPFQRAHDSVLQVPLGVWTLLRLGEGQCDVTESCMVGMRAGEECDITLSPLRTESTTQRSDREVEATTDQSIQATVELHSFSPGKESWEMSPEEKWKWVRSHKEQGGVRFRSGDVWGAADSYSRALKLLISLCSHARGADIKDQLHTEEHGNQVSGDETQTLPKDACVATENVYKTIKAELHANMSLCQLKLHQPARARASAAKATQLEPCGPKAWYRLGQACLEVAELGEARQAFRRLLELQPDSPAAQRGLREVGSRERETNNQLGQRLSKMFN